MAADAVVSVVAERLLGLLEEQARYHINLVKGAEKEVVILAKELQTVRNVLDDAERRGVKEESIKDWLVRLEQTSYEMEDVLGEWNYAILKLQIENHQPEDDVAATTKQKVWSCLSSSSCLCFKKVVVRHHVAKKILDVKEQLDDILMEKDRYNFVMSQPTTDSLPASWRVQSDSSVELDKVHGREFDRDNIVSKLMFKGDSNIVSVVGVGGLGKTTLAQLVYNDSRVKKCFDLRIWICVSDPFDEVDIAKRIVESVKKGSSPNTDQLEVAIVHLREAISGKKFLLVLDDVWNEDYAKWKALRINLKCGGEGSKVLVTTRNGEVARMMGTIENDIYRPLELSPEECWSLLRDISLSGRSEEDCEKFRKVGKEIASKCKGLPLAATVLGGLLQFKDSLEEWENILVSEIWQLEKAEAELFPHLLLTYNELSPTLKRCFSYCAVYPKDSEIEVDYLIEHWIAQGYMGSDVRNAGDMELKGREYFKILAMRSLFQDFTSATCKMHDIVHDFAQFLRKDRSSVRVEARMKMPTCQRCSSLPISSVRTYRSLFLKESAPPNFCDCLTSLRVLYMEERLIGGTPREKAHLIHLRWLIVSGNFVSSEDFKSICKLYNLQYLRMQVCDLEEVPNEIGNLINLRYLDVSWNKFLKELPESICDLHELRTLIIAFCEQLSGLPKGINSLTNLKHLNNRYSGITKFPRGQLKLVGLCTLSQLTVGKGSGKMGWLKNFNHLGGNLFLIIHLRDDSKDTVEDVREADLRNKVHLHKLQIDFGDKMDEKNDQERMDVVDALEPHPNLQNLYIRHYAGSKLDGWITSPLCQLRSIELRGFTRMPLLPPLGKLPRLEEITIGRMHGLKIVGREFLGITEDMSTQSSSSSSSASSSKIVFPKLKILKFEACSKWEEWEDIMVEEGDSASVSLMPCLEKLVLSRCDYLSVLPHRLLGKKALSLEYVEIIDSAKLVAHYGDMEGAAWDRSGSFEDTLKVQIQPK